MPLSAHSRNDLCDKLSQIGVAAATLEELFGCLPTSSFDTPVTRTQLDAHLRTIDATTERLGALEKRFHEERLEQIREDGTPWKILVDLCPLLVLMVGVIAFTALQVAAAG